MQATLASIEIEHVLKYVVCGVKGRSVLRDCHDYPCGFPVEWDFSQCLIGPPRCQYCFPVGLD